jgi:hypothetical protein
MNIAKSFIEHYEASFKAKAGKENARQLTDQLCSEFIRTTPVTLELLEYYLNTGQFDSFYNSLTDLKYLIEFSDNFSRYWHLLRACSGALSKLKADQSVKGSKRIYYYYFARYGDRRILRNEHWFEAKRWEFLDELQSIYTEDALEIFILKYKHILAENLKIYVSFLMAFMVDLKNIYKPDSVVTKKINS